MTQSAKRAKYDDQLPQRIISSQPELKLRKSNTKGAFLEQFIKQNVHLQRHEQNFQETLKFKAHILDSTVKKKKYNLKRRKRKNLSVKEKKALGLFDIKQQHCSYELYQPLHNLWKDYMKDLVNFERLSEAGKQQAEEKLLKADYHGAHMSVVKAKNPSLVGASGILVQETKNVFKLITKQNKLKVIPKENTVFRVEIEDYAVTIYGNNFRYRASDRAGRKFKTKMSIDL